MHLTRSIRSIAVVGTFSLLAMACSRDRSTASGRADPQWAPQKLTAVNGVPAAAIEASIQQRLKEGKPSRTDEDQWGHVKRLYKLYGGNALWLTSDGLHTERAKAVTNALLNAHTDGLPVDGYPIAEIANAIAALRVKQPSADQLAEADVLLSTAYVSLGEDLLTGALNPRNVLQTWFIDPEEENVDSALVRGLRITALDKSLATMRPQDDDYRALQKDLDAYRKIVVAGGWPSVPAGRATKPGENDNPARLAVLRKRLSVEGIVAQQPGSPAADSTAADAAVSSAKPTAPARANATGATYDRQLAGAVAQFQSRHGINVDSTLGPETINSLNLTATYRLGQIAANLERLRWLPRSLGSRYVLVNVPAFKLEAYDGGKKVMEMKVIVGAELEDRATPTFSDSMEYVVFRPYWLVTPDIQAKEIMPKATPAFMAANNYEFYTSQGKTRVRQRPGEKNSLGLVKFMFPNDFNIYLHDTPAKALFEKTDRAASHGCIRLELPDKMAEFVLGWPNDRVRQAMNATADNRTVSLPKKIPVYIVYFTTYARDGQLYFADDLYGRDDELEAEVGDSAKVKPATPPGSKGN